MASERERIEFLLGRDGEPATVEWVRRTLSVYRRALRHRAGYGGAFRRPLVAACCEFRRWLRQRHAGRTAAARPVGDHDAPERT